MDFDCDELYAGGGLRMQHAGKRLKLGVSADVYLDTARATAGGGWSGGCVWGAVAPSSAAAAPRG